MPVTQPIKFQALTTISIDMTPSLIIMDLKTPIILKELVHFLPSVLIKDNTMLQEKELSKACELMRSKNLMAANFSFKTIGHFSDDLSNELILELMVEEQGFLNPLLVCEFKAVRNLKLDFGTWDIVHLPDLRFEKVESHQWEGVYYQVFEAEDGKISFLCRDIHFVFSSSIR